MDLGMGFDPDSAEDSSISVKGGFFWAPWLLQASEVLISWDSWLLWIFAVRYGDGLVD
jgi:hypothetical protein